MIVWFSAEMVAGMFGMLLVLSLCAAAGGRDL